MPSLPLPPLSETSMGPSYVDPYIQSAYNSVLDAERRATGSDMDLMHARVIGFLMIALHDFRGTLKLSAIKQVSKGVRSPLTGQVDSAVYELGEMYRVHLLRAFRKSKGSLPPPSQHPSRPSFTTLEDMLKDALDGSGKDHESVKNRALARDGFCCMLSGNYGYDRTSVSRLPELKQSALRMVTTNCCYILSESTLQNVDPEDPECNDNREYTGKVLSVLESFGLGSLVRSVSTLNGIHHLSNVLTMSMQLHDLFDDLSLWLEGTGTPHEYNICVSDQLLMPSDIKERTVRFWVHVKDVDEETLPLPDPALLALHAACARAVNIATMMGKHSTKASANFRSSRLVLSSTLLVVSLARPRSRMPRGQNFVHRSSSRAISVSRFLSQEQVDLDASSAFPMSWVHCSYNMWRRRLLRVAYLVIQLADVSTHHGGLLH